MIASPGSGWQQFAKLSTPRSAPVMRIFSCTGLAPGAASSDWPSRNASRWRATTSGMRLPSAISASSSSSRFSLASCRKRSSTSGGIASRLPPRASSARSSMRWPKSTASSCCRCFRYWRIAVRALPVTTDSSHAGFGTADGAVMISTSWPDSSRVRSGSSFLSTRAATAWSPTSVCTA